MVYEDVEGSIKSLISSNVSNDEINKIIYDKIYNSLKNYYEIFKHNNQYYKTNTIEKHIQKFILIKTTTMKTADNVGNMTLCLQSFTDYKLDIDGKYNNGDTTRF